jgi:hypothetical protein
VIRIEIENAVLSIDSDKSDRHGAAVWAGDSIELAKWLPSRYGMFGHKVGDYPCPSDVIHALIVGKKKYKVLEGQEILDMPISELPEGAVS